MNAIQKMWADFVGFFGTVPAKFDELLALLKVPTVFFGGFSINSLIVVLLGALFLLAFYAVQRRGLSAKLITVIVILAAVPGFFVAMVEQLSRPKELSMQWLREQGEKGISVDSVKVTPPKRIYIMMEQEGESRLYYIPWTKKAEESLRKALEARKGRPGKGGDLRLRFEESLEKEPQFYELPWQAPPPKDGGDENAPAPQRPFVVEREA
jgi:hypothetical protein